MDDGHYRQGFEAAVRGAFATLVNDRLPAASRGRDWPVVGPEGFKRVLLDHAVGAPWEAALPGSGLPAASLLDLIVAIEMGERLVEGSACIVRLNRRSRAARAPEAEPARQAVGALLKRARAAQPVGARRRRG